MVRALAILFKYLNFIVKVNDNEYLVFDIIKGKLVDNNTEKALLSVIKMIENTVHGIKMLH